jgi:Dyp-type peroxidase family
MPVVQLINPEHAVQARWLRNFQGNILKPHGRDHVRCLFFTFRATADPAANRQGLTALADYVTSALQQYEEGQARRAHDLPGPPFGHLALSASGYRALGFSQQQLQARAAGAANPAAWAPFLRGMRDYGPAALGDPDPAGWNQEYRSGRIDGLMLLADHHPGRLDQRVDQVTRTLNSFARVRRAETGRVLRNAGGKPLEHFGYLDGISQPVFLQSDLPAAVDQWDPRARPELVRVADPFTHAPHAFGSFLVYRKLEQRVRDFVQSLQQLANRLDPPGRGDLELAAALVAGRFRDGTPLTQSGQAQGHDPVVNNFSYAQDPGRRCPFQAHIRKVNPRGDDDRLRGNQPGLEPGRRIVRRGIPYGARARPPTDWSSPQTLPNGGLGLLFLCYQANIVEQFVHLQQAWANRQRFPRAAVGRDPLIGQVGGADGPRLDQLWPRSWNVPRSETSGFRFDFGNFVTLRGGEFFFVPSLPFLRAPSVA